jgi:DHA1 family inner membrane transport protein
MTQQISLTAPKNPGGINPRIFLLALGMFALGTDANVVTGVLPVIARATGVTEGLAGQLITIFSLTYGLGAPLLAAFTGRWSPNRVLLGSLALFCLTNVGSALAPSFSLLFLTRILAGCFAATYAPLAYMVGISLAPPEKRGQALALVVLGLTVANALGVPLGTWIGEHFGWHMSFVLVAGLAGLACLVLLLCGLPKVVTPSKVALKTRLAPIAQPRVVFALLPALLWNIGAYTSYTYLAPLLQQNLHVTDVSGLLIIVGLGIVLGSWYGGKLSDRFGSKLLIPILLIASIAIDSVLALCTTNLFSGLLILFIFGGSVSTLFILQQHYLLNIAPEHASVILALNNSTFYLGIAGGAALGGVALHSVAVTQLCWISAFTVLLGLLLFVLNLRLKNRPVSRESEAGIGEHCETEKALVVPE